MLIQEWNNEKDIVVTDRTPMFSIDVAQKYEIGAFCVNTEKGIFFQKKHRGNHCIVHVTKDREQIIFNKAFVSASNQEYTCMIVYDEKSKENYLIDARGEWFLLPHKDPALFLGPGQYGFKLNKMTGCYMITDMHITLWRITAISLESVLQFKNETAADESLSLNQNFINFFNKVVSPEENKCKYMYHTCGNNKQGRIVEWLIKNGLPHEIVPNIFEDDDTINIRVELNKQNLERKDVLYLFARGKISYSIYGLPLEMYISVMSMAVRWGIGHKYFSSLPSLNISQEKMCLSILNTLKLLTKEKSDKQLFEEIFEKLLSTAYFKGAYDGYGSSECSFSNNIDLWFLQEQLQKEKDIFQEYESSLLAEMKMAGIKISKWVNETAMFELIHKNYPDAIYQYRTKWLGQQSLDVYIPSLQIAFEYQGKQHFEPVEYFGGEKSFRELQERDSRKLFLCKKNGVHIIYWNYDEPISERVFKQKMI